jgi:hypothetical protein
VLLFGKLVIFYDRQRSDFNRSVAIEALVVSALDNYSDRGVVGIRQLVSFTYLVVNVTVGCFDWSMVAVFFGFGAKDAAVNSKVMWG